MKALPIVDGQRMATSIEWTHIPGYIGETWNVGRGCRRTSPGCGRSGPFKGGCYAERQAIRMSGPGGAYEGLVRSTPNGPRWTGKVRFDLDTLQHPLHWRKPRAVFVDSMSDLFYEEFTDEQIAAVFGVMAACPQHLFIVLTKRAERMRGWFEWLTRELWAPSDCDFVDFVAGAAWRFTGRPIHGTAIWPLPNVMLGVSVESKAHLHRLDALRATPAAMRVASLEPLLEDLGDGLDLRGIDQALVGGESGPSAAPCGVEWIRLVVGVARRDGCAPFVKQFGARPFVRTVSEEAFWALAPAYHPIHEWPVGTRFGGRHVILDGKGNDPSAWPEFFRVREWPKCILGATHA